MVDQETLNFLARLYESRVNKETFFDFRSTGDLTYPDFERLLEEGVAGFPQNCFIDSL
jgi:hypothetical protein